MIDNLEAFDLVRQTLESDGVLNRIRAQLRSSVYSILIKNSNHTHSVPNKVNEFANNPSGMYIFKETLT